MSTQQKPSGVQALFSHPLVQQASQQANARLAGLDKELSKYQFANEFESRTKVPKAFSFLGLAAFFVLVMFFNMFGLAQPLSGLIGYALPAYFSMQALESPGATDDQQWLTYWTVFSTLTVLESVFLRVFMHYIPFYFVAKSVFLVWLQLPGTRGAEVLYRQAIHPALARRAARSSAAGQFSAAAAAAPSTAKLD